jgi:hypothetical protein
MSSDYSFCFCGKRTYTYSYIAARGDAVGGGGAAGGDSGIFASRTGALFGGAFLSEAQD